MKVTKYLKVGLAVMFFFGMSLTVTSCGEQGSEGEQTEESADEHSEEGEHDHSSDEEHEHPVDGEEHPAEHPTE